MTLDAMLEVPNFAWRSDAPARIVPEAAALTATTGRFASAGHDTHGGVWLARDKLGLNKLFAAFDPEHGVLVASFLHELLPRVAGLDGIFAVSAGTVARLDPDRCHVERETYFKPVLTARTEDGGPELAVDTLRSALVVALRRIRERVGPRVAVCLSGGLDSALIAAYARDAFEDVHAYTYSFDDGTGKPSDDARGAERVANHLGLPHTTVSANRDEVLDAVDVALRYGQDWRDFNVHCAIVNVVLARAIAGSERVSADARPVALTGDTMNEFLADYSPVELRGRRYYDLPTLPFDRLRRVLVAGLQAGDREVGVFHAFGVDVLQPYALCCDELMRIPSDACERTGKRPLMHRLADGLLPERLLARHKVRAQIGDTHAERGILPVLIDSGHDAYWLEERYATLAGTTVGALRRFLRGGVYRAAPAGSRSSTRRSIHPHS